MMTAGFNAGEGEGKAECSADQIPKAHWGRTFFGRSCAEDCLEVASKARIERGRGELGRQERVERGSRRSYEAVL